MLELVELVEVELPVFEAEEVELDVEDFVADEVDELDADAVLSSAFTVGAPLEHPAAKTHSEAQIAAAMTVDAMFFFMGSSIPR